MLRISDQDERRWCLHAIGILEANRDPRGVLLVARQILLSNGAAWGNNPAAERLIERLVAARPVKRKKRLGGNVPAHHLDEQELL